MILGRDGCQARAAAKAMSRVWATSADTSAMCTDSGRCASAASSSASAAATSTWRSMATIAVLMCQPHCASVSRACSSVQPVASIVSRSARAMSFEFEARRSTIRLPKTLCSRTISALENVLSAIFCAVPAFKRVEPLMTSAPVASVMP